MLKEIGIKPKNLNEITAHLTRLLADEVVLYVKTLNAHWNVEGPDFYNKHLFFEGQSKELAEIIDAVAERIRALDHYAPATLASFIGLTSLTEQPMDKNDSSSFIEMLLEGHYVIITGLRKFINAFSADLRDAGTENFTTGLIEIHEKMAWMLRAHLA